MKQPLRKLFAPILNLFEKGDTSVSIKKSHRPILKGVGALFFLLSLISLAAARSTGQVFAFVPCIVFLCVSAVCLIVGFLGTDEAVAKIWGNK
ncbi:MAG: hypothetical protein AAGA91_15010 [Pseudomonadota bacterium]